MTRVAESKRWQSFSVWDRKTVFTELCYLVGHHSHLSDHPFELPPGRAGRSDIHLCLSCLESQPVLQCQPLQMSGLHCALVPEMELGRKGHSRLCCPCCRGSNLWLVDGEDSWGCYPNIFNHCCKSKKLCQSKLFIINKAISQYGKAFQCPCNALLTFVCMALHYVMPNGDRYPKLSARSCTCFSRISFSPLYIHQVTYLWDWYSFCDSSATFKSFWNQ